MNRRTNLKTFLLISIFFLAMGTTATGKIIFVDANAPGPTQDGSSWTNAYNYLQDGLADANSALKPVEIRVAEGTYTPDTSSADPNGSGDRTATFQLINGVTLKGGYAGFGEPDPNARDIKLDETILSGDLNGDDEPDFANNGENSYHVVTGSGTDATAVLDGFTITASNAIGSYPNNYGGGMYNDSGSPTVTNCTFSGNFASSQGGGMYNSSGNPTIANCIFIRNSAYLGGGMYNNNSNPTLTNCTFSGNSAAFFGGGMYNENSSPILNFCTFSENSTYVGGGGIYNYNSSPTLTNCTFRGNRSNQYAGGMDGVQGSSPVLVKCTFSNNSAGYRGGGISHAQCNPVLNNCIFSGNSADNSGGGVYCHNSTNLTLNNCIFAKNKALIGEAVACDSNREQSQNILRITNCILWDEGKEIWNNDGSTITISYTNLKGGQAACYDPCDTIEWDLGNTDIDPCFADPGCWDPNGTLNDANDDFWIDGDYHLKSQAGRWDANSESWVLDDVTSPCIDAGNPGCSLGDEPNDANNIRINMGAYGGTAEASKTPANWRNIADLTNDWTVDFNDLAVFVDYWLETGECIPSDLDRSQFVDFTDFALLAWDWLDLQNTDCLPDTLPEYPLWVALGKPLCWCYPRQCHGDMDGLSIDGFYVNALDVSAFSNCYGAPLPPGCECADFNRDGQVDLLDANILVAWYMALNVPADCGGTLEPEPTITYQVDDCNMEAGRTSVVAEESGETRFSVRVEGSYIHFEDLITANCCADEIELQMTVEGNLITIYEIEHLTMPCPCICDYPVTATLGPFEEGDYLVEVIDVNGSSLGAVEVTIGEPIEPSITYQIEDCNQGASGLFASGESPPTRFSVTVEGRYIYFEDMMVANCCPDELGLEMTVENNLIIIYETEYTPGGCFCICDYPVTATLGPFEPGTYILEVYEDWSGFIESTVVTIASADFQTGFAG